MSSRTVPAREIKSSYKLLQVEHGLVRKGGDVGFVDRWPTRRRNSRRKMVCRNEHIVPGSLHDSPHDQTRASASDFLERTRDSKLPR